VLTGHGSFLCNPQETFTPTSPYFHNLKNICTYIHIHTHTHTSLVVVWLQHYEKKIQHYFPFWTTFCCTVKSHFSVLQNNCKHGWHNARWFEKYMNVRSSWWLLTTTVSWNVNLLKSIGYMMHQQLNIQQFYILPTAFVCFVFIWEHTATCATYTLNWLVFITKMKSVYCVVWTGSLNKAVCA
jgi:hypothetical protein